MSNISDFFLKQLGLTREEVDSLKEKISTKIELVKQNDFEQLREKFSLTEKEIEVLEKISEQYKDK